MIVYGQISCICLHANEGRKSKTKDSVYNVHVISHKILVLDVATSPQTGCLLIQECRWCSFLLPKIKCSFTKQNSSGFGQDLGPSMLRQTGGHAVSRPISRK